MPCSFLCSNYALISEADLEGGEGSLIPGQISNFLIFHELKSLGLFNNIIE